jgi:hypothetical protein
LSRDGTPRAFVLLVGCLALGAGAACAKVSAVSPDGGSSGSGGQGGGSTTGKGGTGSGNAGSSGNPGTAGSGGSSCTPVQCTQPTGQYCGIIGDGCFNSLDCGTCPGTQVCDDGVCVGGPDCVPLACQVGTGSYCGTVGNGCGHAMNCGACAAAGQMCSTTGVCVKAGCVPLSCDFQGGQYCGMIGDGCGGMLDCGTCSAAGATCGGGGLTNVCGSTTCATAVSCMPASGGQYCGMIGNGCGGVQTCPACPDGTCPANGVCPGTMTGVCTNLQCQIQACTPTTKTSISGTVFDPAGKTPLYNALVYVPNAPLADVPEGVSCDRCSITLSGSPVVTALTDTAGNFTLTNAPSGANIPLVIQIGKWRRQVTIANVNPCVDNPVDPGLSRLPRDHTEGHMPKIALTTGKADALECFLRKTGISDSEFTIDTGTGRVNMYEGGEPMAGGGGQGAAAFAAGIGGGATFPYATTLWSSPTKMAGYDIIMMSCEGSQFDTVKAPYVGNVKGYADAGGRLFNGHLHYYWIKNGPAPWPTTGTYNKPQPDLPDPTAATINTAFPKGAALAAWLVNVGASTTLGALTLYGAQSTVPSVNPPTQSWINISTPTSVEYLTFNTPVEVAADAQCGRVVETDIHVKAVVSTQNGKDTSQATVPFPGSCKSTVMSPQEKALEFLFFDLAACVQPDTQNPEPPPPPGVPMSPPTANVPPPVPPPPPPPPPPLVP